MPALPFYDCYCDHRRWACLLPCAGDHGPINSWDRNAFITDVKYGSPSYTAQMNEVGGNMIIANYGASQGFDTDDGSSWYNIHDNFFFEASKTAPAQR